MNKPYTIRLFVPDGEPNEIKIIDKMNWTGTGIEISRDSWEKYKNRKEMDLPGIYILVGYEENNDLPTIYVGQGDSVKTRIEEHIKKKDFWDKVYFFVSINQGLNRAHTTWLEWALIEKAHEAGRCNIENSVRPNEPNLTEFEKADTKEFLSEILSILPLVEIKFFQKAKKITPNTKSSNNEKNNIIINDTVVVPAQEEGFKNVFLNQNCWYAIRIGGGKLKEIKYIAAYQTAPVSAVTHIAEVKSIEPYGDGGKYKLNFKFPAKEIRPIVYGNARQGILLSSKYTNYEKLLNANEVSDLFDWY